MDEQLREIYSNFTAVRRRGRKAKALLACCILPCAVAFAIRDAAQKAMDVLGGKSTIGMILTYNWIALALLMLSGIAFAVFVVRYKRRHVISGSMLVASVVGGTFLLFTFIYLCMCLSHIFSDYKGSFECSPKEYVLSTLNGSCYVTFEDGGDYAHLVVPQDIFDELAERDEKDGTYSDMLQTVEDSGYNNVTLYDGSGVTVKYFFYSAIFDSAEIKD
jgi:hypothetical protein